MAAMFSTSSVRTCGTLMLALLAIAQGRLLAPSRHSVLAVGSGQSCASLKNEGTHFTISLAVGTPPQLFDVVADTGSDSVIVPSCLCNDAGRCDGNSSCFRGINHSSTFMLADLVKAGVAVPAANFSQGVPSVVITFGSGSIEAMVASDVVQVGSVSTQMANGVLLMVDQALNFGGKFEGILGLGIPRRAELEKQLTATSPEEEALVSSKGFLQTAGIPRFSMCFNGGGQDGVLRLGPEKPSLQLGSVGQVHWGLDFRGISVVAANASAASASFLATSPEAAGAGAERRANFCDPTKLEPGQETACGAIPDSGTTLLMGPAEHLVSLLGEICESWPKCKAAAAEQAVPGVKVIQDLLMDCESWMEKEGLNDLPALNFHLAGSEGKEQTLTLPPNAYIIEMIQEEVKYVKKNLAGVFDYMSEQPTGKMVKVCGPAFGKQDYNTKKNGPVWILGTPIFYEYQVVYDMEATPPAISFSDQACGGCPEAGRPAKTVFVSSHGHTQRRSGAALPRQVSGPPRVPNLDTSLPL
mmetsp:Transcript_117845/g.375683  ORF Transcript_117845/g.375683 Transcript_117845/m.375683 type:complete len:527 (+) Transcript_117845:61-1641(+)